MEKTEFDDFLSSELEGFNRATQEILEKSDRTRVVLLGAELDRILSMVLRAYLIPTDSKRDALIESSSTFSTRIELGYRIGLLNPEWVHDLRIINTIRDDFAHGQAGLHLGASPHKELCSQLKIGIKWAEIMGDNPEGGNAPTRFVSSVVVLGTKLIHAAATTQRIEEHWQILNKDVIVGDESRGIRI